MKTTITLELTAFQVEELKRLGGIQWPGEGLTLSEVCRRILLDGADGMRTGEWRGGQLEPRHLLDSREYPHLGDEP